ncbi:glycosyltransferase [bacterium]|jgi:glycosyltransferase involved in cell wall biosynthesis|nr:glycosyltransferase [bacterium]
MKVSIYHPWIYVKSGLERTIVELVRRSRHDWRIYTSHYDAEGTYPALKDMGVVEIDRVSVKRSYGSVLSGARRMLSLRLPLETGEPLVVCCDGLGSLLNFRHKKNPLVSLCFTPLRAVYDLEYRKRHLAKHASKLPLALAMEQGYKFVDRRAWRHYDKIFAISQTVKDRIIAGGLDFGRDIEIAFPGIRTDQIVYLGERLPYFFLPGRIMWTKNIELGIASFQKFLAEGGKGFRLVIAGMVDEKSQPYFAKLRELAQQTPEIEFVQDPSDEAMEKLYRECYGVLFTAFNEDLGLTPLEGMAKGKPPIAVNRGGPTEIVAHEVTGLLADPEPAAFAKAMTRLANDRALADRFGQAGVERSKLFTWDKFVAQIDQAVEQLGSPRETR